MKDASGMKRNATNRGGTDMDTRGRALENKEDTNMNRHQAMNYNATQSNRRAKMKEYTIKRQSKAGDGYESMVIRNRETGADVAEYRVEPGRERAEVAAMRRTLARHLNKPGATMGNYQW
jgi:hypothetical protein